jgi:hypothetical protein
MPPTAELLRQLKPPPEITLITRFCDDVIRRRRPQRMTIVQPLTVRAARPVTPPQLMGRWGPIPEEEVSVWPTLFHAQDIEVVEVERFLTWLKRMQTRESGWLFNYPEMAFPPRPMAPFLDQEATTGSIPVWRPAGIDGYVPTRGDRLLTDNIRAYVPTRGERMLPGAPDGYVPARRPRAVPDGFVPTGERADRMRRTMAAQRLRAIEAEDALLAPPAGGKDVAPPFGAAATPPIGMGRGITPFGVAAPAAMLLAGVAASRFQGQPSFTPLTMVGRRGAPFSPETPAFDWQTPPPGSKATGLSPMAADRNWTSYSRTPSPIGGSAPVPYPQLPVAGMTAGQPQAAGQIPTMMQGKVTWQLPAGREWTANLRATLPVAGFAPIPYPRFAAADFRGMPTPIRPALDPMPAPGVTGRMTMGAGGDWTRYARTPSPIGGPVPIPYPHLPVNAAGFMAAATQRAADGRGSGAQDQPRPLAPGTLLENPYLGQMTLIAPPLRVASEEAEDSGTAVAFNWETLTKGQGALDARGLAALRRALPDDAQLIYPALPKGQLPAGAVNLRLAQPTVAHLLEAGYGVPAGAEVAARAVSGTVASIGATPQAMPLTGQIVPGKRPAGTKASILPSREEKPGGELPQIGTRQAKRGGALDFLGLPVSLAPSLGGRSEVREAVSSNVARDKIAKTIRPNVFGPLRHSLFPSFQSIEAEPDRQAWEKAAPSFGLRDSKPMTVLAPQARAPMVTLSTSLPQIGGEQPPAPGTFPQMHIAEAAPVQRTVEAFGGMPRIPMLSPPTVSGGASGLMPSRTPASLPWSAERAHSFSGGGQPVHQFRPISGPSIGPSASAPAPPAAPGALPRGTFGESPAVSLRPASSPASGLLPAIGAPAFSPINQPRTTAPAPPVFAGAPATPSHPGPMPSFGSPGGAHPASRIPQRQPISMPSISLPESAAMLSFPPPVGGGVDIPMPTMHLPAPPSVTSPGSGMRARTNLVSRAPAMLYTPPAPRVMTAPLALQRSVETGHVQSEAQAAARPAAGQGANRTEREGQQGAEISLLATEVWSILKQRLATEAIRRGRW